MPYLEVQLTRKLHRLYDVAPQTVIGRAPQCTIQLLSRAVSRRHAQIEFGNAGEAVISDLGTKNGIKVKGQRIHGAAVIGEGDDVVIGDVRMIFRTADRSVVPADVIDLRRRAPNQQDLQAAMGPVATFALPAREDVLAQFGASIARTRIDQLTDFDEVTRFKLQIALKEALDNARVHGSCNDPNRHITVTFRNTDDEFEMTVRDEGPGYEADTLLAKVEEVDALAAIRERTQKPGPMGLRIMLNCVDRLQFESRGSTIHMGKFKEAAEFFVLSEEDSGEAALPPPPAPLGGGLAPDDLAGMGMIEPGPADHSGRILDLDTDNDSSGDGPLNLQDLL